MSCCVRQKFVHVAGHDGRDPKHAISPRYRCSGSVLGKAPLLLLICQGQTAAVVQALIHASQSVLLTQGSWITTQHKIVAVT